MDPLLIALPASLIVLIVVSLCTARPSNQLLTRVFPKLRLPATPGGFPVEPKP